MFYLTEQTLRELVTERCTRSKVNFEFVYGRVLQKMPKTFDEFKTVIEDVLHDAYWGGEIEQLFKGCLGKNRISKQHAQSHRKCI